MTFEKILGASYWASYFINGDASSFDDEEQAAADAWLEKNEVLDVVDCGEPFFSWNYDLYADPRFRGGELVEYIVRLKEQTNDCDK